MARKRLARWSQALATRSLLKWLFLISLPLVPALYHGYFVVLRNAVASALEGIVIERSGGAIVLDGDFVGNDADTPADATVPSSGLYPGPEPHDVCSRA